MLTKKNKNAMKKIYKNFVKLFIGALVLLPVTMFAQSNQYLHFDKVDDFAILDGAGQYVDGTTELSITGWFYCDELSYGQGYMGFRAGSGSGEFYLIQLSNGVMECRLLTTTGLHEYVAPANTAIPQLWQHIAWIYTGSEIKLYVNGFFVGGSSASGVFSSSTVPFGIGKSLLGGFNFVFGGRIDEVTVWDKALSQSEIEDMMDNELTGNEDNLQLYYKFNQGEPGGNNTAITHLISEIGDGERDAELMNFALEGETSNFNGELNTGYQAISFPQIANKLTTDEPFEIEASATSGLDVLFEIISGPATLDGNVITLTGAGEVVVEATQPGDDEWDPADPVQNSFMVLDPMLHVPEIDARSPLAGDVYVPTLGPVQLATIATIEYPELFDVQNVSFEIDGVTYTPINFENGHYFTWWTPPAHGSYTVIINASNNFGAVATETVSINVTATVPDIEVLAFEGLWCNTSTPEIIVDAGHHNFNRNDPYTNFSYQSYAHNVLLINNQNYRPNEKYFGVSKIDDHFINNEGLSWVKGHHPHYRHLNIEKVNRYFGMDDESLVYIKDVLTSPDTSYTYQQLFTLRPEFENVEKLENDLILASSNNSNFPGLAIYPFISNFNLNIRYGVNEGQIMGWYFEMKNQKIPTNTIILDYRDLGHNVELPVIMEVIPPSEVHNIRGRQDLYLEKYRSKKEYLSFSKQ